MQRELQVIETLTGEYRFFKPGIKVVPSESLGTTMIDIKEPKRKKLVYQWLWERIDGILSVTPERFGLNDRDMVRQYINVYAYLKEGGILKPIMESEKEIDV